MAEPRLLETREVALEEIVIGTRLRPVSPVAVRTIAASFETVGAQIGAVTLRRKGDQLLLMCGGHRVAAARELGRKTVRAEIWECQDQYARFFEVHENLASSDLSLVELAQFLAEAKDAYERLNPTAKQGVAGALARWGMQETHVSFASAIAEKRGISERHVQRLALIGRTLDDVAADHLRHLKRPASYRELVTLCAETAEVQRVAARSLADGSLRSAADAVRSAKGELAPRRRSAEEIALDQLRGVWSKASRRTRRAFLDEIAPRDAELLRDALAKIS